MEQSVKISIITVCLNCEDLIEKTIRSVLSQDYDNIEYIVIDGCSSDGTGEIIEQYDSQISAYIREPDNGVYDAMNKGIRKSTGDLVGFIGAGDWYEDGAIKAIAEAFYRSQKDVIYGDVTIVEGDIYRHQKYDDVNFDDIYYYMPIVHPGLFVRRELQIKWMFDDKYRIAADYKFLLQIYHEGASFQYVEQNIEYYILGGLSYNQTLVTIKESRTAAYSVLGEDISRYRRGIEKQYAKSVMMYDPEFFIKESGMEDKIVECLYRWLNDRDVLLWGAGNNLGKCLYFLNKADSIVSGIIDNGKAVHADKYLGIPIVSDNVLCNMHNTLLIVTTTKYEDEVKDRLSKMDIPEDMEIDFFSDFFDRLAECAVDHIMERI